LKEHATLLCSLVLLTVFPQNFVCLFQRACNWATMQTHNQWSV